MCRDISHSQLPISATSKYGSKRTVAGLKEGGRWARKRTLAATIFLIFERALMDRNSRLWNVGSERSWKEWKIVDNGYGAKARSSMQEVLDVFLSPLGPMWNLITGIRNDTRNVLLPCLAAQRTQESTLPSDRIRYFSAYNWAQHDLTKVRLHPEPKRKCELLVWSRGAYCSNKFRWLWRYGALHFSKVLRRGTVP